MLQRRRYRPKKCPGIHSISLFMGRSCPFTSDIDDIFLYASWSSLFVQTITPKDKVIMTLKNKLF